MRLSRKAAVLAFACIAQAGFGREAFPDGGGAARASSRLELAQVSEAAPSLPLADLLARSQGLSRSGKAAEAYELLLAAEDTYIGTPEFDYALGRAALEAGHPDKATLAFTRVLALDPTHAGASIDMGRAYLALGDVTRARTVFQNLLALNPPPEVRAQLQAFLDLTNAPRAGTSGGLAYQGFLALMVGRSSNVNQSPSQSVIFLPALSANFVLPGQNVRIADKFAGIVGGVDSSWSLGDSYSLVFGGQLLERRNFHETDFDLGGVNAYLGLAAAMGRHAWRLQGFGGRDWLGAKPSRDLGGISLDYVGALNPSTQFLGTAQGGQLRYVPEDIKIWDANYTILGAGAAHKIDERSTVFVMLSTGYQSDKGGSPSGNKSALGLRAGGEMIFGPRIKLTASAAGEWGQYDKLDTGFQVERRDIRQAYELDTQYWLDRAWSLRLGFSYTLQSSNIPIYEYSRTEWVLRLRRDFQ
ncbi:MAG TPA: tetratricopeptide repeat protein [Burkholderiales bacterium]|nr:tetratricopeptide repeat protein [Burkholderiales bacterium]